MPTPKTPEPALAADGSPITPVDPKADPNAQIVPPAANEDPLSVDIKAAVQKARQQEKDKLYAELQRHQTEASAAKAQNAQLTAALEELNKKLGAIPAPSAAPETKEKVAPAAAPAPTGADMEKLLNTAVTTALKRAEDTIFGPRIAALEAQVKQADAELKKRDLEAYRGDLIANNKEGIVPELVTGSTREELDLSLVRAKQAFAQIAKVVAEKVGVNPATLLPLPPINGGAGKVGNGTEVLSSVGAMSDTEYAAKRAEILKVASEAARAQLQSQG